MVLETRSRFDVYFVGQSGGNNHPDGLSKTLRSFEDPVPNAQEADVFIAELERDFNQDHTSGPSPLRYECFCARTQVAPRWSQKVLGCPPRPAEVTKKHFRAHGGLLTIFSKIHFLTCLSHILSQGK